MSYGVTPQGFVIKRFQEILKSVEEDLITRFGNKDQSSTSILGNINAVITKVASDIWEVTENVYTNFYPNSAEGVALDNAVLFNGLLRLKASSTVVELTLIGDEGTLIPAASQFETNETGEIFQSQIDVTITEAVVLKTVVNTVTIDNNSDYTITIDSIDYTYTSDASATKDEIIQGLVAELSGISGFDVINNNNENISIFTNDRTTKFSCSLSSNLQYDEIGTPIDVFALNKGSIAVPTGSLTEIVTPIFGLDSVINLTEGEKGRNVETDNELRLRREESLQVLGSCTLDAIYSRILDEVEGITSLRVYHNPTDVTDSEGRNPHSVEVVVEGGNETLLAQKIFEVVAAGIQSIGNQSFIIFDTQNNPHEVKFTRPVVKYAHIRYTITLDGSGTFPLDGEQQIIDNTLEIGETFNIGDDYLIQKFYNAVYQLNGVENVDIEIAVTNNPTDPPIYQANNIQIGFNQVLVFSNDRVELIGI